MIATGLLKLEGPSGLGSFESDAPSEGSQPMDKTAYPEVVAETTSHQHVLREWQQCGAYWFRPKERLQYVPHFHFRCDD